MRVGRGQIAYYHKACRSPARDKYGSMSWIQTTDSVKQKRYLKVPEPVKEVSEPILLSEIKLSLFQRIKNWIWKNPLRKKY